MPAGHRIAVWRSGRDPALHFLHPGKRDRSRPLKLLISAAETSSDAHGAELLKALRRLTEDGESVDAFGIGGPKLQAAGFRTLVDARRLLAMGFFEILTRLPQILAALRLLSRAAERERPELAVVIDYPDFHFRLARRLKRLGIPVVYFIPPKVWVWRKSRIRLLRERFERILCILPFEEDFYKKEGLSVTYVGNPLVDELPLAMTRAEARAALGLDPVSRALVVMVGSRPSELKRHLEILLDAASLSAERLGERLQVLLPFPHTSELAPIQSRVQEWRMRHPGADVELRVSQGDAHACLVAADAGLIKSGTSTLEAGLLGCPHVVVYRPNWFTEFVFYKFIRYTGPIGLVNLVAGWKPETPYLIRECLAQEMNPATLADEVRSLITDEARRSGMLKGLAALRSRVIGNGESPSLRAAREILALVRALPARGGAR